MVSLTRTGSVLAAVAAAVAAPLTTVATASAAPVAGGPVTAYDLETFENQLINLCLTDGTNGLASCTGSAAQTWSVTQAADTTVQLKNSQTGRCLYSAGTGKVGFSGTCGSGEQYWWFVTQWGDGTIRFQNQATAQCLGAGYDPYIWVGGCDSSEAESWF